MKCRSKKDYSLSIELILALAAVLYFIKCSLDFPFDPDLFAMVKWGEALWNNGVIHVHYPYSWVPDSCRVPWVDYEWLCHVVLYLIQKTTGFAGTILLKTLLYAISFFTLFWYARKTYGLMPALVALLVALYLGRWFLSPRPMSYTAAFFPILTYLLISLQARSPGWKDFIVFPLLFIVWENFHGGFFVGLIFMALAVIVLSAVTIRKSADKKEINSRTCKLLALWALCIIMTLFCTPYGSRLFMYVIDFFTTRPIFMQSASDMASPLGRIAFNAHYFVITAVTTVLLAVLLFKGRKKITPIELLAYFFWLLCSMKAVRNMQLFSTAAIPVLAFIIAEAGSALEHLKAYRYIVTLSGRKHFIIESLKLALLSILLIYSAFYMSTMDLSGKNQEKAMFPTSLKDFLLHNRLPSRLFNHDILGDYFIFYLYPQYLVSFDSGWNNIYSDRYFIEIHQAFHDKRAFHAFVDKYDLDTVVIHYKYYGDFIAADPSWIIVYEGENCRVFLRNCERNQEIIDRFRNDRLNYPDTFEVNAFLYRSHLEMKHYAISRKYLIRLIIEKPDEESLREQLPILNRILER